MDDQEVEEGMMKSRLTRRLAALHLPLHFHSTLRYGYARMACRQSPGTAIVAGEALRRPAARPSCRTAAKQRVRLTAAMAVGAHGAEGEEGYVDACTCV